VSRTAENVNIESVENKTKINSSKEAEEQQVKRKTDGKVDQRLQLLRLLTKSRWKVRKGGSRSLRRNNT
jgi:hypothetical protein